MNALVKRVLGERIGQADHKIEIECSDQALEELLPLLRQMEIMGNQGSSRSIKIEDWDGPSDFGFDGDGNAKIRSIKVDGQEPGDE